MDGPSLDLLTRPWLPCRARDGRPVELGLRDLLRRARDLDDLACTSPLTYAALLRLLVAVLHAVFRSDLTNTNRARWWLAGWDQERIDAYLDQWADRFDLFSPERPFWQDPNFVLPAADTLARLAPELASGNNTTLFDHTTDTAPPALTPAEAARWLVTHQLLGLGGGKGPTSNYGPHEYASHAPATYGVSIFLRGSSLFETLLLNAAPPRVADDELLGRPLWERDFPPPGARVCDGLLDRLTWPNRCARLLFAEQQGSLVVTGVYTAQGSVFDQASAVSDPFHAKRVSRTAGLLPLKLSGERTLWRDSAALFGFGGQAQGKGEGSGDERPWVLAAAAQLLAGHPSLSAGWPCVAAGMDSDKSKINLWRSESLPVPAALLSDGEGPRLLSLLCGAVAEADAVRDVLNYAVRGLAQRLLKPNSDRRDSKDSADRKQVDALQDNWRAEARFWSQLDGPFRALMADIDSDDPLADWRPALETAADLAFETAAQAAGNAPRALRARVRARQSVTHDWRLHPKKTQGGT